MTFLEEKKTIVEKLEEHILEEKDDGKEYSR